ncbi:serine-tRNA ligase [Cyphellophora europaea CBS 101466]|uniref:serine--tRNA ligase n=1 Tax=Cyphellophora europaea (strain CBS 101466) TaxID=1220924 RepID=W2RNU8_CYPE1|nr:serine-tRNA ligase [Cyphellophora europaea CBS 101466]ETN38000.1 serine-tRNA ligase [Cyphellophora europaea CBS 101466]
MSRHRISRSVRLPLQSRRTISSSPSTISEGRPPTAPKQTPNLAHIRQNADLYAENARLRNYTSHIEAPAQIVAATQKIADIEAKLKQPRTQVKALQARMQSKSADRNKILEEIRKLKPAIDHLEKEQDALQSQVQEMALGLPNLTSSDTPLEGEGRLLRYINYDEAKPPTFEKGADHSRIGEELSLIDFAGAGATSGWGFYYLMNEGAMLEQALVQYALRVARRHGWGIVSPPSLVYAHVAESCGFQPRDQHGEQQIWQVAQSEREAGKPKRSLAATAEIPLAGLYAGKDINEGQLPVKMVGSSRCYRAEAGARGVDTKGLYRVHEFTKVEMFAWTNNSGAGVEGSMQESTKDASVVFDEMVTIQTEILTSLGLPCRVLEMPVSDLGASAYRKIDIEALFPSRLSRDGGWGEVTSTSICTDYQSRRLNTRILDKGGSRKKFAYTLNGTAIAVPRVLAAVLEHGWREQEKCVMIPEVLRSYMGGIDRITPVR